MVSDCAWWTAWTAAHSFVHLSLLEKGIPVSFPEHPLSTASFPGCIPASFPGVAAPAAATGAGGGGGGILLVLGGGGKIGGENSESINQNHWGACSRSLNSIVPCIGVHPIPGLQCSSMSMYPGKRLSMATTRGSSGHRARLGAPMRM